MNNTFTRVMSVGLASIAIMLVVMVSTSSANEGEQKPLERRDSIRQAINTENFDEFVDSVGENANILNYINESNFGRFVEMHKLLESANVIREELGLPNKGMGMGIRRFQNWEHKGMLGNKLMKNKEAVIDALEANDYNAFVEAMTKNGRRPKMLDFVTAENFDRFVEMYNLRIAGDADGARLIGEELGLPYSEGMNKMKDKYQNWKNNK